MNIIQKLPESMIRQIAAGEVVVRPVSIVKELVENAIDAGSKEIDILVHDGGKTFIQVEDDGYGMELGDLKICLDHHATSKLRDLWNISTLGFRGEALYAISSVCDIEIKTSKNHDDYTLIKRNNEIEIIPSKPRLGTKITVSNIFQNTPARLKFLRSDSVEWNLILDYVQKISLSYPKITWTISNGSKILKKYRATDVRSRVEDVFKMCDEFFKINYKQDGYKIEGLFSKKHYPNNNFTLFVNDRYVKDKAILGCIRSVFEDYIPARRWPLGIMKLYIPNNEVDVNIHPTKEEVRLLKWNLIRNIIVASLYNAINVGKMLSESNVLETFDGPKEDEPINNSHISIYKQRCNENKSKEDNVIYSEEYKSKIKRFDVDMDAELAKRKLLEEKEIKQKESKKSFFNKNKPSTPMMDIFENDSIIDYKNSKNSKKYKLLGQIKNSYIVAETEEGILLIDQHAVHERYTYENMKKEISETSVGQKLLIPIDILLTTTQLSVISELKDKLSSWGLMIEGGKILSIPSFWTLSKINYLLDIFLTSLEDFDIECQDRMMWGKFLADVACKNSIRAGTELNDTQLNNLIDVALKSQGVCNHGRKSTYIIKLKDIEKMFDR